ncbi:hypothetical protein PVK06_015972 [Gossypium arboreum]|uniref:Uncharacterized protein n=1 Tax=Gossypium arboreum TaxID=29729 RepID=A0ABR0PZF1_GOSAR|nr:hypothetical protein PVK06_015972 [Gossypium arboreum]
MLLWSGFRRNIVLEPSLSQHVSYPYPKIPEYYPVTMKVTHSRSLVIACSSVLHEEEDKFAFSGSDVATFSFAPRDSKSLKPGRQKAILKLWLWSNGIDIRFNYP